MAIGFRAPTDPTPPSPLRSMPAIEDLRECLLNTNLHRRFIVAFRNALMARLLHPGGLGCGPGSNACGIVDPFQWLDRSWLATWTKHRALLQSPPAPPLCCRSCRAGAATSDIIQQYVSAVKALSHVDPGGAILGAVGGPIAAYLRGRRDTIRCVVTMLTADDEDEAGQSLLAELGSAEAAAPEVGGVWSRWRWAARPMLGGQLQPGRRCSTGFPSSPPRRPSTATLKGPMPTQLRCSRLRPGSLTWVGTAN